MRKTKMLSFRVTGRELGLIRVAAQDAGMSVSDFVRDRCLIAARADNLLDQWGGYAWPTNREWEKMTHSERLDIAARFLKLAREREADPKPGTSGAIRQAQYLLENA